MATPKWPHDHAEKHSAAAKLGWRRRRGLKTYTKGSIKAGFGSGHHTEKKPSEAELKRQKLDAARAKAKQKKMDEKFIAGKREAARRTLLRDYETQLAQYEQAQRVARERSTKAYYTKHINEIKKRIAELRKEVPEPALKRAGFRA